MEDQNQFHKIVAFTGHRPGHVGVAGFDYGDSPTEYWKDAPGWKALRRVIVAKLTSFLNEADGKPIKVISGGALGMDLCAAEAALSLKAKGFPIVIELAEPFKGQHLRWSDPARRHFLWIENLCDIVTDVSAGRRENAYVMYYRRNVYMVENATVLLAFLNSAVEKARNNGTEGTILTAKERGVCVENLFDETIAELTRAKKSL